VFIYWACTALVASFTSVILLHAWFVRRLTGYRERLHTVRDEYGRLHAEVATEAQAVADLGRGKESNALSITALEREIEELRTRVRTFLTEHPELGQEFGGTTGEADAAADEAAPSQAAIGA
jgi:hypothetical protein